jgi:hypothetical protein
MLGLCRSRLSHFPNTYAQGAGSSEGNPAPPRPDPLRVWARIAPSFGDYGDTNLSLRSEGIQDRAYLYIGVTSSSGAGLCGVPGEGDSKGIGAGICKILDMNFGEFLPTFMCVVQARILDDAHGGRGWLENSCR